MLVFDIGHLGVTKLPTSKTSQALFCIFLSTPLCLNTGSKSTLRRYACIKSMSDHMVAH